MRASLAVFLLPILGCAAPRKVTMAELTSDIQIDSLPSGAQVSVDGRPAGVSPVQVSLPPGRPVTLTVALGGFTPRTLVGTREQLLGSGDRLGVVLLPAGFTSRHAPDMNDPTSLAELAHELERRRDWGRAAEAWARVLELAPRYAPAHRGMGSCLAKLGRDEQAIREYEQYLFLAPDAPDAAKVRHAVDSYRGGIDLPGGPQ
ncbi:MAG: tetratricopeptide repeat protein [Deltaproteobacteria bacterium]